ncbi:hypothetical protein BU24DRAFT_362388, partial [Aaosphaeria arxii CBS 175.79]
MQVHHQLSARTCRLETSFEDLPLHPDHPVVSAWGIWGDEDELGTLNLLDDATTKAAAQGIKEGLTIPLNLPLDSFPQPMNPVRKSCTHHIIAKGHANDDELHINTQGSSHWDGLRHYPYQQTLQYYNGVTQEDISGERANERIGVHNQASKTITGRAVLLDWAAWAASQNISYDPFSIHAIPLAQLQAVATSQKVEFKASDILLIRTGWLAAFKALSPEQQRELPRRQVRSSMGVEASEESLKWHWNNAFAAVASDTVAYESWPSSKPNRFGVSMHEVFLSGWGMPIGESFDLEVLSKKCRELGKWSFFFASVPLYIKGGVASPPNAVAIL